MEGKYYYRILNQGKPFNIKTRFFIIKTKKNNILISAISENNILLLFRIQSIHRG